MSGADAAFAASLDVHGLDGSNGLLIEGGVRSFSAARDTHDDGIDDLSVGDLGRVSDDNAGGCEICGVYGEQSLF